MLFMVLLVLPMSRAGAAPDIMTSDQLSPGMQGYAKTVVEGARIDTFSVEIVGVLNDSGDNDGRIIARVSGDVIDQTGGVLQGMSGSPVYIDGKLIGAISGGWKEIDNRTCIITPIADMLKLWEMPDVKNDRKIEQVDLKETPKTKDESEKNDVDGGAEKSVAEEAKAGDAGEADAGETAKSENTLPDEFLSGEARARATPLMVAGFSEAGLRYLADRLEPFQMVPYAAGGGGKSWPKVDIEPGSSVAAQLVRGDISMAAIGTVTAVEDGKVLAFGHPFLRKGNVNYFMTDAQIIATASGTNTGFKVGAPGNLIGRVNQDRSNAISGILGEYPSVIPLSVRVEDAQLNRKKTYSMQIAYDEALVSTLVTSMVYSAMDQTIDRLGEGTAQVSFEIMTNAAPGGKLTRDNMFYNLQDVGQLAVSELTQALNLLAGNTMRETDIVSVKVKIQVDQARKTASIVEAAADKTKVKPGETVNLKLKIKPYREAEELMIVPYKVPKHQPSGPMTLEARGGGLISVAQLLMQQQGIDLSAEEDKTKPLEVSIKEFLDTNKNNEIIVAPAAAAPDESAAEPKPRRKQEKEVRPETAVGGKSDGPQQKYETSYIIDNVARTSILVADK